MDNKPGRIVLLNGTSSAGKSTLASALRAGLGTQFHYYASDQLADAGFRPTDPKVRWEWREAFFRGFHHSIPAFANTGIDLLVEHIVESRSWADELSLLLAPFDVFWVGVHAPLSVIVQREQARGNRQIGEALEHLKTHEFCAYDIEVDTTDPVALNVETIKLAWHARSR